jgi:hypothetical protein
MRRLRWLAAGVWLAVTVAGFASPAVAVGYTAGDHSVDATSFAGGAGDLWTHMGSDEEGDTWWLPGYGRLFTMNSLYVREQIIAQAGGSYNWYGVAVPYDEAGYTPGHAMTPQMSAPADGQVMTYIFWYRTNLSASYLSGHWIRSYQTVMSPWTSGPEIRTYTGETMDYYDGTTLENIIPRTHSASTLGYEHGSMVLVIDRRPVQDVTYYRMYHDQADGNGRMTAFRKGSEARAGINPFITVPCRLDCAELSADATKRACIYTAYAGAFTSTDTALADHIINMVDPTIAELRSAFDADSRVVPALPVYTGDDQPVVPSIVSSDTSIALDAIDRNDMPATLGWVWDKVLTWLPGFGELLWFVPFLEPDMAGW